MSPGELWAVLGVEEGGFHRFTFPADWAGVRGLNQYGEDVPFIGEKWGEVFVPVADRKRFDRFVGLQDVQVSFVPRRAESADAGLTRSGVLWVRLDSAKQYRALERFRPSPTFVLREGNTVRRVAVWVVRPFPNMMQTERANRRLAHALDTRPKFADPGLMFHPPGVTLRWGRERRPITVAVEYASRDVYTPAQVAGHLRDAPDPGAWRDRLAA